MKARELSPGDIFRVTPPDPESPTRVCLTNDEERGLRFGWPGNARYWCYMGEECPVELVTGQEKLCLFCEHFRLESGAPGYSALTPGSEPEIECTKRVWQISLYNTSRTEYRAAMLTAGSCPHFKAG